MNIAVFGLAACVLGAGHKRPADTGSIWIQFLGGKCSKEYDRDHPIFEESNLFCNMLSLFRNVKTNANEPIEIQYGAYAFDIVAGLLKREPKKKPGDTPISFKQLLHVFELIRYLDFNEEAKKNINSKLCQKTLDGKNAEKVFVTTSNDEMPPTSVDTLHTSLAYFLCLRAYAETHGLHTRINTKSSAVEICVRDSMVHSSKYDNLLLIQSVSIQSGIDSRIDESAINVDPKYRKESEHVVNTILKICKEAGLKRLDVGSYILHPKTLSCLVK